MYAAYEYLRVSHSPSENGNDFQHAMNIAVIKAFVAGALWQKTFFTKNNFEFNDVKQNKNFRLKGTTGKHHGDIQIIEEKNNNLINK